MSAASVNTASRMLRVRQLLEAMRGVLADETSRASLVAQLRDSTQLCTALIQAGLNSVLEHSPTDAELGQLVASVAPAKRVWITLSANVFSASFRAVALGVAASEDVKVKPSTRESVLVHHLAQRAKGLFELCSSIAPEAGDHVHAYGSDQTMRTIRAGLADQVEFFGHGSGLGLCVVDASVFDSVDADALTTDTVLFEQQGCLSPRLVYAVADSSTEVVKVVDLLSDALREKSRHFPLSPLLDNYQAERLWFERTALYCGRLVRAGGSLLLESSSRSSLLVPPPGRCLTIVGVRRGPLSFPELEGKVTTVAVMPSVQSLVQVPLGARTCGLGEMQRPPFDGPVDLRRLAW